MREGAAVGILTRPARLERRLADLLARRELRGSVRAAAGRYGGVRTGRRSRYRDGDVLSSLAELDSRIGQCRRELDEARRAADAVVRGVSEMEDRTAERDAALLRVRFVDGQSWEAVRQELREMGCTAAGRQTLYNWAQTALRRANAVVRAAHEPDKQNSPPA